VNERRLDTSSARVLTGMVDGMWPSWVGPRWSSGPCPA
jgi:hypothetical protein